MAGGTSSSIEHLHMLSAVFHNSSPPHTRRPPVFDLPHTQQDLEWNLELQEVESGTS